MPRKTKPAAAPPREIFHVDWPLFGELSRALALKVAREFDADLVIGIATAGVVPGAVVAAMIDRPFRSMIVSRRYRADAVRATPAVFGEAPPESRGARVLVVDETCDSGETMRLAVAAVINAGAKDVRTAVSIRTGEYEPDFAALETPAEVVLPWDREVIQDGALVPNPKYDLRDE
jgi:hypoxanthine phosphoribosyltransferase